MKIEYHSTYPTDELRKYALATGFEQIGTIFNDLEGSITLKVTQYDHSNPNQFVIGGYRFEAEIPDEFVNANLLSGSSEEAS